MKILTKYISTEFIKPLIFSVASFSGLVMISEFFRELNFYLEKKTAFFYIFINLLLNTPWWAIQILPVAVLLAVLFSLGQLAKQGEITAMKAAGINLRWLIVIFVILGFFISISEVLMREYVVPQCVSLAEKIKHEKIKSDDIFIKTKYNNLVVAIPDRGRMTIGELDAVENIMQKIVIDYYNQFYELTRQLVAENGKWNGNKWVLNDVIDRSFSSGLWKEISMKKISLKLPFKPEDFIFVKLRPEEMTSRSYLNYINQMKTLGIPYEKELVQFHLRFASAFSHIIVMIIGIPFALGLGSRHGKIVSFSFALLFAFIYWGLQAVGQSLGENQLLSPHLSAWIGNIVFGIAGILLLSRIKR